MVLLGDEAQVEACFSPFRDSANLEKDRCTVCTKRTIGLEIISDTMMVLLCVEAQVDARFGLFGGSAKLDAR